MAILVPVISVNGGVSKGLHFERPIVDPVHLGNTVFNKNADALGTPMKTVAPGEIFGPKSW
jgi:hypothetical protein